MYSVFVDRGGGNPRSFGRTIYLRGEFLVVKGRDVQIAPRGPNPKATRNPSPP